MNLPSPCENCAPFNGAWMETEAGLRRCTCARGQALRQAAIAPPPRPPVLSEEQAAVFAEMLGAIPYFLSDAGSRAMAAQEIAAMCGSLEDAKWLVTQMVRRYQKWPGIIEMRAVFCSHARPLDGELATSPHVDALTEREQSLSLPALPAPAMRQLPAGEPVSAAPSIAATLSDLVRAKDMNRTIAGLPPPKVREIPVVQITDKNRITAEDIRQAERELRDSKARKEIEVSQ